MQYLRKFNESLSQNEINEIRETFFDYFPQDFEGFITINPEDGTIDVRQKTVIFSAKNLDVDDTGIIINFGVVETKFAIIGRPNIDTLEGSPHTTSEFLIRRTGITDLVGGPESVNYYNLEDNPRLQSLKGLANAIDSLSITNCPITSLEGCPDHLSGYLDLSNTKLTSLVGGPSRIDGDLNIDDNNLTSIEGLLSVGGDVGIKCWKFWDPSSFRNFEFGGVIVLGGTPIGALVAFFYTMDGFGDFTDESFYPMESWKKFQNSLDYNWVRICKEGPRNAEIIHFKFMEVLSELDWDPMNFSEEVRSMESIGDYHFVDEEGEEVDLAGRRLYS